MICSHLHYNWQNSSMMNFHHIDEFVAMTNFHHQNSSISQRWILTIMMNSHQNDELFYCCDVFYINFHHNDTFHHSDEFQSQCWIFILIMKELKNLYQWKHIGLYLSQWWIFIIIMYYHHGDKLSSKLLILLTKISLNQLINFHQNNVFSSSS